MQQFRDGVVLRMCCGLTFTLFVGFFDKYYAVTIPKSRFDIFFNFLVSCVFRGHPMHSDFAYMYLNR